MMERGVNKYMLRLWAALVLDYFSIQLYISGNTLHMKTIPLSP